MKATSIWEYIFVGTDLRFLQDASEGDSLNGDGWYLEVISRFLDSLDKLGLHVTSRASTELVEFQQELAKKPKTYVLTSEEAHRLKNISSAIRKTFAAETTGVFTYVITDKRIDIKKLLNNIGQLFSPEVFINCGEIACHDFAEAGKCIAFERSTAAAFHILRGTESVLRLYYKRYIKPAQSGLTWGQMTHALSSKSAGKKPDPLILGNLNHIRLNFRNPTQHPDKIYDIQEAQDLFGLCIDAVNRMMKVITK